MLTFNLSWVLIFPTIALALLFMVPTDKTALIRRISQIAVLLPFLLSIWVFAAYDSTLGGYQFVQKIPWVVPLGISESIRFFYSS
jgi:NADH-quinone oxidoreductase subunit M